MDELPPLTAIGMGLRARRRKRQLHDSLRSLLLWAEIENHLLVPEGGGRPTDPRWTTRRLIPLAPDTLRRLEAITATIRRHRGRNVQPMQLAALLLAKATEQIDQRKIELLIGRGGVTFP